jgi:hypothetical protein
VIGDGLKVAKLGCFGITSVRGKGERILSTATLVLKKAKKFEDPIARSKYNPEPHRTASALGNRD